MDILEDQKQRDLLLNQLDKSFFVEAGAGSGKTTTMVKRMVALLELKNVEPSSIVAITFTNQASVHMKEKFQETLERRIQCLRERGHSPILSRLEKAYEDFHLLFIGTVHSFCLNILKEMPIEAGLDCDFALMDDEEELEERHNFWGYYKHSKLMSDEGVFEQAIESGIKMESLDRIFDKVCENGDVSFETHESFPPSVSDIFEEMVTWLESFRAYMPLPTERCDTLSLLIHKMEKDRFHYGERFADNRKIDYIVQMSGWGKLKVIQKLWTEPKVAKSFVREKWPEFKELKLDPWVEKWMDHLYQKCMPWVIKAVHAYTDYRYEINRLSLTDVLICTTRMLKNNPSVRNYWKNKIRFLLVDEFQDTDPIQSELFMYLTGEDIHEKNWRKLSPRQGSLFFVGDPKQSIYRFRRADIRVYEEMKALIKRTGGNICSLTSNFRSIAPVGSWVNDVFDRESFFPKKTSSYQAQFSPLRCVNQERLEGGSIFALRSSKGKASEKAMDEALQIAKFIRFEVDQKGSNYSDYLILSYKTSRLKFYVEACQSYGIPVFLAVKERKDTSLLLKDMFRLFQWMLHPDDEFLGYGVLRSALFAFTDTDLALYRLKGKGSFCLKKHFLDNNIVAAIDKVFEWKESLRKRSAVHVLIRVFQDLRLTSIAKTMVQGDFEANMLSLFLDYCCTKGNPFAETLSGILALFEKFQKIKRKPLHGFEKSFHMAVNIMNLHQAKGLEAKTVFLVDPGKKIKIQPEFYIDRDSDGANAYMSLLAMSQNQKLNEKIYAEPKGWTGFSEQELNFQEAEHCRLLYVAATRAEERLVVSAQDKTVWGEFFPFLEEQSSLPSPNEEKAFVEKALKKNEEEIDWGEHLENMKKPSFMNTEVSQDKGEKPDTGDVGLGVDFGIAMHKMFEKIVEYRDSDDWKYDHYMNDFFDSLDKVEASEQIALFFDSSLWERVKKSEEVYTEVPFSIDHTSDFSTIQTGLIDLVFKESEGWVVVDYKTDKVSKNFESLVTFYKPQILSYKDSWVRMTQEKVKESLLYFSAHQREVSFEKIPV
ncbi:hypothetical protein AB834_04365 [PVC group bacterium (ex Bugula neritina AB1)]|nr:hypothetical protein AB834_04365 [PVC group bacterium (ex Bugula neritina AB1)]